MDLRLTEEEQLISRAGAQFVDRELIAREGAYLKQAEPFLPPGDPPRRELDSATRTSLRQRAREIGLWALELPDSAGGAGLNCVARVLVYREFGRTVLPFEPARVPALLARHADAPRFAAGDVSVSLAMAQTHRSGDLSAVETRFRPTAGGFELSNTIIDVFDPEADFFLIPAREDGTHRVCLFLLERSQPGVSVSRITESTADLLSGTLALRDCRPAGDQMVGYEYEAAAVVASEQLRIAARSLGIALRCVGASIEHARNRVTFGRPLASRQAIQWMLADLAVGLRTCTWLTFEAAWRCDRDLPYFKSAALAKKRAAKLAFQAADTAIQIHGGYGVCREFPFEGFYRQARLLRLLYGREAEMDRAEGEKLLAAGL